jgi:hypothetical protein
MLQKKGQSVAEYALIIATIIIAISSIQTYIKRGLQGRLADASDDFVNGVATAPWDPLLTANPAIATQFEPLEFSKQSTTDIQVDSVNFEMKTGGEMTRSVARRVLQGTTSGPKDYQKYDYTGP